MPKNRKTISHQLFCLKNAPPKLRKIPVQHETNDCKELHRILKIIAPRYGLIYTHIANGGKRPIKTAQTLKAMGMRSGVWDYYFRRAGLPTGWLEMKHGNNTLSENQAAWRGEMALCGDIFMEGYGAGDALKQLIQYRYLPEGCIIFDDKNRVMAIRDLTKSK